MYTNQDVNRSRQVFHTSHTEQAFFWIAQNRRFENGGVVVLSEYLKSVKKEWITAF